MEGVKALGNKKRVQGLEGIKAADRRSWMGRLHKKCFQKRGGKETEKIQPVAVNQ